MTQQAGLTSVVQRVRNEFNAVKSRTSIARRATNSFDVDENRLTVTDESVTVIVDAAADNSYNRIYARGTGAEPATWPVDAGNSLEIISGQSQFQGAPTYSGPRYLRTMTDADSICWYGYMTAGNGFMLYVDGRPVQMQPYTISTTKFQFIIANFNGGPKNRLIEIYTNIPITNIYCRKPYTMWKPAKFGGYKMAVIGDSHVAPSVYNDAGTALIPVPMLGFYQGLAPLLGIEEFLCDGYGGSGYLKRGASETYPNYLDRLQGDEGYISIASFQPDLLIAHGGGANDLYAGFTDQQIIDQAILFFTEARALLPNAKLVMNEGFTMISGGFNFTSNYIAIRTAVQAALTSVGVYYVDVATTDPWLKGLGKITAPNADAENANLYVGADGVHYNTSGAAYLRNRMAQKLRIIARDDGSKVNQLI
jgi:hypothetical protein